jgi:hypothetical protein
MNKLKLVVISLVALIGVFFILTAQSCEDTSVPTSTTGVQKISADVEVQASGMTVEQENIRRRLEMENMPGSIKHLYVISAYSGQVILYSTVKGKVTSSGKRLSPYEVESAGDTPDSFEIRVGGKLYYTPEVLQDDGTYGSSIPYLYWWDVQDRYHQHYVDGGQIVHISDKPIPGVKAVILNVE